MILSNVSVPLLGMVDTGVTGHLDDAVYLGAVAIGATIFGFVYGGLNFLRMGTTGITAQCFGAGDNDGLKLALGQSLIVALAVAVPIGIYSAVNQYSVGDYFFTVIGYIGLAVTCKIARCNCSGRSTGIHFNPA